MARVVVWLATNPARALVLSLVVAYAVAGTLANVTHWHLVDADGYWQAGLRLRHGEPLYHSTADPNASNLYRYAPWFAALWVPLTYLPYGVVMAGWTVVLLASTIYVLWPRSWSPAWIALSLLLWTDFLRISSIGNVQSLMMAALAFGLQRRSGPVWIAMAASLKFFPLLFTWIYIASGQWRRAEITVLLTALLVAPIAAFDLSAYPLSLAGLPLPLPLQIAVAIAAGVVARLFFRYRTLGTSVLVMFASLRWTPGIFTYLALGPTVAEEATPISGSASHRSHRNSPSTSPRAD